MKRVLTSFLFILCAWFSAMAQFSGSGSGTSSDPYKIYNPDQLNQMRNFLSTSDVYFKLMQDIDLANWISENYPSQGWLPIGTSSAPFRGVFDGNGKSLTNLSINRSGANYVGFFGDTSGATIKNLIISGTVKGKQYTGSLIGYATNTTINGYTFNGTVTALGSYCGGVVGFIEGWSSSLNVNVILNGIDYVGGLFGNAKGNITTAQVCGKVDGSANTGGAIGMSKGIQMSFCNVNAPVTGATGTGGIVGNVNVESSIDNSKHIDSVIGTTGVGGVVGDISGKITLTSCYADGNIKGTSDEGGVGGICGILKNSAGSNILNCSCWGNIEGNTCVGGIIGSIQYTNVDTQIPLFNSTKIFTHKSGSTAGSYHIYNELYFDYDYSQPSCVFYPWKVPDENYKLYTIIKSDSLNFNKIHISGCTSVGNIKSVNDFIGGILGKDDSSIQYLIDKNYIIKYYKDEFDYGTTTNLKSYYLSHNYTQINDSYFSGALTGNNYVGGIVGYKLSGIIENNYSSAIIKGKDYVGGIAGYLIKTTSENVPNNLRSNVSSNTSVFATGASVGCIFGSKAGYFTIESTGSSFENRSLATTKLYKNGTVQTVTDNLQNGTAVGISQLRYKANYVAWGWDFNNNWKILDTESFPYKSWQTAPPTYDGQLASGTTIVSGKSVDGGNVTVITTDSNQSYTTSVPNNTWSVTLNTGLHSNETVQAYAQKEGLEKSYMASTTAGVIGSGTPENPYLIYNAYDLAAMTKEGNYKLMNDIDLTSWISENSSSNGWEGVGVSTVNDSLVFEGNGHKITGLWSKSTSNYAGLFSKISGSKSIIRNLTLENVDFNSSANYLGGIIGSFSGKILNCCVSGSINGTGTYAGLLAGYTSANVTNCSVSGTITGTAKYMGGIIGYSVSNVNGCSAEVSVTNTSTGDSYAGGLCGYSSAGTVSKCKATGTVCGRLYSGGLCGYSKATLSQCLTEGVVLGQTYVGGLTGYAESSVANCYSTAEVTATSTTGTAFAAGLVGYSKSTISNSLATGDIVSSNAVAGVVCYLEGSSAVVSKCVAINDEVSANSVSGFAMRVIGGYTNGAADPEQTCLAYKDMAVSINNVPQRVYDDPLNGTATTMDALKTQSTYTGLGWNFSTVWYMNPTTGFPDFIWNKEKEAQTISLASIPTMTYGSGTYTLPETTDQGLVLTWTSSNTDVALVSGNTLTIIGAGTTTVEASQSGNESYMELFKDYSVTINKAPLTIRADNKRKIVGTANPELTVSYTGFVNGDTENTLTTKPSVTTTANANSPVGTYPITASGAVSSNYVITYVAGTLTIVETQAINELAVEPVSMAPGSEQNVSVSMENESQIIMAEFYLQLPEGFEIATDEDGYYLADINSSRSNRHQLEVSQSADDIYHFLCYSSRNNAFNNNSGELISMTIVCADGIGTGNYKGWIKNIILSDVNKNEINPDDFSFNIEVKDYTMGDVNGDTRINGLDIVEMVDKIMGRPSDTFIFAAGDFDGNGVINGMDLVEEVALVMSQTISGAKARRAPEKLNPDMASMNMSKSANGGISVGIDSSDGYILSQFVLELSDGQQLTDITASDRNHIVAYQPIGNNCYMVICYSLRNATFTDNKDILRISCKGIGTIKVNGAMLVNADRKLLQAGDAELSEATGIELVNGSFAKPSDIYSISGTLVKKDATSVRGLGKGIYVVDGKTLIIK